MSCQDSSCSPWLYLGYYPTQDSDPLTSAGAFPLVPEQAGGPSWGVRSQTDSAYAL